MSDHTQAIYTVQEASERAGLSAHTLRYYERAGLLAPIYRIDGSGHRRYCEEDLRLIEFLKRMRSTGMPIHQLQRYIALVREGDATIEERLAMLEEHRGVVCERIRELQGHLDVLEFKIANYRCLGLTQADAETEDIACVPTKQGR